MARLAIGLYGAIALSLTAGAAQFALGHDLSGATPEGLQSSLPEPSTAGGNAVNRGAKADRAAGLGSAAQTRTISLRLEGFADTSFLLRVPATIGAGNSLFAPSRARSGERKLTVACEPVVSVLAEVAKQLQPGRCVT